MVSRIVTVGPASVLESTSTDHGGVPAPRMFSTNRPSLLPVPTTASGRSFEPLKVRDYQDAAVDAIFRYFENGGKGNPLIAMPTATGKSIVIAELIKRVCSMYPGQRI